MKAEDIRQLNPSEIQQRITDELNSLQHLRFQNAIAEIENPGILRVKKKLIARFKTVLAEKNAATKAASTEGAE